MSDTLRETIGRLRDGLALWDASSSDRSNLIRIEPEKLRVLLDAAETGEYIPYSRRKMIEEIADLKAQLSASSKGQDDLARRLEEMTAQRDDLWGQSARALEGLIEYRAALKPERSVKLPDHHCDERMAECYYKDDVLAMLKAAGVQVQDAIAGDGAALDGEQELAVVPVSQWTPDPNRCAICGWSLVDDKKTGCVRGNCSQRPLPMRERWYDRTRAFSESQKPTPPIASEESEPHCGSCGGAGYHAAGKCSVCHGTGFWRGPKTPAPRIERGEPS